MDKKNTLSHFSRGGQKKNVKSDIYCSDAETTFRALNVQKNIKRYEMSDVSVISNIFFPNEIA